jgi:hypothetical protein
MRSEHVLICEIRFKDRTVLERISQIRTCSEKTPIFQINLFFLPEKFWRAPARNPTETLRRSVPRLKGKGSDFSLVVRAEREGREGGSGREREREGERE